MPKETVLRPNGIATQPNEYGDVPPGTLSVGDGIQIRRKSVIEPRNAFEAWQSGAGTPAYKLWPLDVEQIIKIAPSGAAYETAVLDGTVGHALALAGPDSLDDYDPGKTHITRARDRVFFTYAKYPVVWDPTDVTYTARQTGLPPPVWIDIDISTTAGDGLWLLTDNVTAYRALYKRKFSDGYLLTGAVSITIASNIAAADCLPQVTVYGLGNFPLIAGDLIELYRVPQQISVDLLGGDFQLATVHEITSGEASAGWATFYDSIVDEQLEAYLYVNETQQGPSKQNFMPPRSYDVCTFKKATFYASSEAWHAVKVTLPGLVSESGETRGFGGVRATHAGSITTNGSPVITNVASLTGIVVGQVLDTGSGTFPSNAFVISTGGAGPFTVTMSAAATATINPYTFSTIDTIEIDGVKYEYLTFALFMEEFALAAANGDTDVIVIPAEVVQAATGSLGVTLTFFKPISGSAPFTIRASNGGNLSPPLPAGGATPQTSKSDPRTDRAHYSKIDEPEAVPPDNTLLVGSGTILKLWATQDSLFAFCSDGIFRIDGDGDDWSVKPVDPDTVLLAPDAVDSMDNNIYAFTTAGLISLTDSGGVRKISASYIDEELRTLWNQFTEVDPPLPYTWGVQIACDKQRSEVWLNFNDYEDDGFIKTWIWHANTETFVTQSEVETVAVAYAPFLRSIVVMSEGTDRLDQYDPDNWMDTDVEFNSVYADDLGLLKQWIDVTLFLEDLDDDTSFLPRFEGVAYGSSYTLAETAGAFDHVVAPLLTAVHNKHLRFGYVTGSNVYYRLKGLTFRYRLAAEALTR